LDFEGEADTAVKGDESVPGTMFQSVAQTVDMWFLGISFVVVGAVDRIGLATRWN
jgi:hypothetical protein